MTYLSSWCHNNTIFSHISLIFLRHFFRNKTNSSSILSYIMKNYSPKTPFLLMMLIFLAKLCDCREFPTESTVELDSSSSRFLSKFSWHIPAASPARSRSKEDESIYGVSSRKTPGGPNPLHNWSKPYSCSRKECFCRD